MMQHVVRMSYSRKLSSCIMPNFGRMQHWATVTSPTVYRQAHTFVRNHSTQANEEEDEKNKPKEKETEPEKGSESTEQDSKDDANKQARKDPKDIKRSKEFGGPKGPEPTRYGDWEKAGRVSDF
mmetsp:Transcript_51661/g.85593  ORF Transcript_51661/g.85593 Transcript_51661/m.85593 type:complete len:124 (-) Transcript_51661:234-605(-)